MSACTRRVVLITFAFGLLTTLPLLSHGHESCKMNGGFCGMNGDSDDRNTFVRLQQAATTYSWIQWDGDGAVRKCLSMAVRGSDATATEATLETCADSPTQKIQNSGDISVVTSMVGGYPVGTTSSTWRNLKLAGTGATDASFRCLTAPAAWAGRVTATDCAAANSQGPQLWRTYQSDAASFGVWQVMLQDVTNPDTAATSSITLSAGENCLYATASGAQISLAADCATVTAADTRFRLITPAAVQAQNDPEVVNAKGERFKVYTKGGVTLLHIPREAHISQAALVMVGDIQELDQQTKHPGKHIGKGTSSKHGKCPPTYVRNLFITGSSLGNLSALTFHSRNKTAPFLMGLGNGQLWLSDGHITSTAITEYMKLGNITDVSIAITPEKEQAGSPVEIQVNLGVLKLTIVRPHVTKGKDWQFMNVRVNGLEFTNYNLDDIGGIMGTDSPHKGKSKSTDKCLTLTRKMKLIKHKHGASPASLAAHTLQEVSIDSDDASDDAGDD